MGSALPELSPGEFGRRLRMYEVEARLTDVVERALFLHYEELRRWNPRLSLVGPGTAREVVERHYGESLAALPLLPPGKATLLDVGSGAGFPGLVLAAARPELEVTLIEPRRRKWGFLRSACRRSGLPCRCLDARVGNPLPEGLPAQVDVVTVRALGGITGILDALMPLLSCEAQVLVWRGRDPVLWPDGFRQDRRVPLAGSQRRWIEEARRQCPANAEQEG